MYLSLMVTVFVFLIIGVCGVCVRRKSKHSFIVISDEESSVSDMNAFHSFSNIHECDLKIHQA